MFRKQSQSLRYAVQQFDGRGHLTELVGDPDPVAISDAKSARVSRIQPERAGRLDLKQSFGAGRKFPGMEQCLRHRQREVLSVPLASHGSTEFAEVLLPLARELIASSQILGVALPEVTVHGRGVRARRCRRRPQEAISRNQISDLLEDFSGFSVFDRVGHQHRDGGQDFPVRPAFADRLDSVPDRLHVPLGIREGAVFLGIRAGREDNMGQRGGFCQEQFLADEKLQPLQGFLGSRRRWQRAHRIFPHHEHCFHSADSRLFQDLRQRPSRPLRQLFLPESGQARARGLVVQVERPRKILRHCSHLRRPLVVVLLGQRRQAASRQAVLSGQQQQIQEIREDAAAPGGSQHALPDQDDGPTRARKRAGGLPEFL